MTETPQSREDWERERDEAADNGKHVAETTKTETTTETTKETTEPAAVEIPDNDDVEPGTDEQPESDDGTQDDPDDDPVADPEPSDNERDELGK